MEAGTKFYFRVAGEARGPATLEQLRDFGSVNVITRETEIAASERGPWAQLATLAICAEVFPVRRAIEFKTAEFETLNRGTTPPVAVDEIKEAALGSLASLRGREVIVPPSIARRARDGDPANEVQAMVLEVGRRIAAHAPPEVLAPRARSWRWVWFAALSLVGTTGILCIPLLYDDRKGDEITFSILGCWILMFNGLVCALLMIDRRLNENTRLNKVKLETLS